MKYDKLTIINSSKEASVPLDEAHNFSRTRGETCPRFPLDTGIQCILKHLVNLQSNVGR